MMAGNFQVLKKIMFKGFHDHASELETFRIINHISYIPWVTGNSPRPSSKTTTCIYGFDPLSQKLSLSGILSRVSPLGFNYQVITLFPPDQKIRPVFLNNTIENIEDFKAKVVIFGPGLHQVTVIKGKGL